jgi:heme exporter protein CcmD
MDFSADHIGFVAAAYALTFAVLIGLIFVVVADLRAQRSALARLEGAEGPRRRRAAKAEEPAA